MRTPYDTKINQVNAYLLYLRIKWRTVVFSNLKSISIAAFVSFLPAACSSITSTISNDIARSLSPGIANQSDIELVKAGIPSYVLLLDGMILENPDSPELYLDGAKLYSTYAIFAYDDPKRVQTLTQKAFIYSKKSLCLTNGDWCDVDKQPFDKYQNFLQDVSIDEVGLLYSLGVAWASYIDSHRSDWNAIANIPKVTATMQRVLALDDSFERGGAHLYLGVLETVVPPALGGKPGIAKSHFERVVEITKGRNLMAKVLYAERYARPLFNRELHDHLLQDVLQQDPQEPGLTLMNVIAQKKAKELLESADDFF
ncbi:TRAP transporter TatT component family protein [Kaarinaea lacus]